jgi:hypothetical protein
MYSHLILKVPQHPIGDLFGRNTVFVFVRFAYADKIVSSWRSKILFKAVLQNRTTPVGIRVFLLWYESGSYCHFDGDPDPTFQFDEDRIRILIILVRIC